MSDNPYRITGPALVSFSGGRTSAFMLWQILQAHGGTLPDDVVVVFANTGKEREETLRFVHEVGSRWSVPITWLEWAGGSSGDGPVTFDIVGYNSASRNGEPFSRLIREKQRLPNGRERWCTAFLKVKIMLAFAASMGWQDGQFTEAIGMRHDEGHRILKGLAKAEETGRRIVYPLAKAKVVKRHVTEFWQAQPFDLDLQPWEGNCDLCFLKGREIRRQIIRDDPSRADWWRSHEESVGAAFDLRAPVNKLRGQVRASPTLFEATEADEFDAECGLICAGDDE